VEKQAEHGNAGQEGAKNQSGTNFPQNLPGFGENVLSGCYSETRGYE
jgi:hypothetical protein